MSLQVKGTVKELLKVEKGVAKSSGNEWQKQTLIVTNNEGYEGKEQLFAFEVFGQESVENLSKYNKVGDSVVVKFNIKSNEFNGRYYTSLQAWRIEKAEEKSNDIGVPAQEIVDDLPF